MKGIWKPIVNLVIVLAVSVGLLFGMNWITKGRIEAQEMESVRKTFGELLTAEKYEAMDVNGAEGISAAYRALDKDGKLVGFAVTSLVKGYGGDMQVHVALAPDATRFLGMRVGNHSETEGYGSKTTEEAFYKQFNSLTAPATVDGYTGIEGGQGTTTTPSQPSTSEWKDGTYRAEETKFTNGWRNFVEVTISGGKIAAVNWDADKEDGTATKKQESKNGTYVMTETGKKWHEQAKIMEDELIKTQDTSKLAYDSASGKTDAYAGVSITVSEFAKLAQQALDKAKGGQVATGWKDGVYKAEQAAYKNGYRAFVEITVAGGKITTANWDAYKEDSQLTKKKESKDGTYVMTETGKKWHEQAEILEDELIKTQNPVKITYDAATGKTDAYAGVSITISEFVSLAQQALDKAGSVKTGAVVNTAGGNGTIDAVSGATVSSKAVVRAANLAYVFVRDSLS